jgi:phosphatidyl-myo-inositol alpha-mannosyltransferase
LALAGRKCQSGDGKYHAAVVRIAIVTDYYYPQLGGITEHVHGQATHLTALGHDVTVVTGHLTRPPAVVDDHYRPEEHATYEVVRIGQAVRMYGNASQTLHTVSPFMRKRLNRLFRSLKVDVVHVHSPYNPAFPMWAVLAAPDHAITCGTFHSVFAPGPGLDTVGWMMRQVIGRIDGKIVVSEACIGSLSRYFPYDYTVIPNGIDDRHFTPDADPVPELADGRRNILFLGRFDPRNGLGTMIDAFVRVRREYGPEVRLVVVGDGPLRGFYQKRVPRDVADDVVWAGRVNWRRPNYYTAADIHCTPCSRASFGMVLLEAMSCGRPVVASRISGFQLVMEHGRHGLMISPADDADRFAEGLLYLLDRPAERARMGREGRITAVTRYSWSSVAEQLEQLYAELLARKRGAR